MHLELDYMATFYGHEKTVTYFEILNENENNIAQLELCSVFIRFKYHSREDRKVSV